MKERAVKEWPEVELVRDVIDDPSPPFFPEALGPDEGWRLMDEYKVETYVPQQRVNALVGAVEETFCDDAPCSRCLHLRTALANYKEEEA